MLRSKRHPRADRVVGAASVGVALVLIVAALVIAPRTAPAEVVDLRVLSDLIARMASGDEASYSATYVAVRTASDGELAATVRVIRRPGVRAEGGADDVTYHLDGRTVRCTRAAGEWECLDDVGEASVSATAIVAEMVRSGRYHLESAGSARAEGMRAPCFRLELRLGSPVGALGTTSLVCLTEDGVPVHERVERFGVIDERDLVGFDPHISDEDLAALIDPFDPELARELAGSSASALGSARRRTPPVRSPHASG